MKHRSVLNTFTLALLLIGTALAVPTASRQPVPLFVVDPAHAACPAHPGHILNGQARQPVFLQVVCGQALDVFKQGFNKTDVKWIELYALNNSIDAFKFSRDMNDIFSRLGFKQIQHGTSSAKQQTFGYLNSSNRKIISMSVFVVGSSVLVSLSGT